MQFEIKTWESIAERYQGGTLLLGNGASMAISPKFGYKSLYELVQQQGLLGDEGNKLFRHFNTSDFELVLRLLWHAAKVNKALGVKDKKTEFAYQRVRDALIAAVRDVHVSYEDAQGYFPAMYDFLKSFKTVFSLNYDLLVYWTMMFGLDRFGDHRFKDCFLNGSFDNDWSKFREVRYEKSNTLVFYPHGSLALCQNINGDELKISGRNGLNLLAEILFQWNQATVVPLFVSEGTQEQKIASIKKSNYLSTVYHEVIPRCLGPLTIYGWGFGAQDRHLLPRMRGVPRIAASVYGRNQQTCLRIYQEIVISLGYEIEIEFFDSGSPGCWNNPPSMF